VLSVAFIYSGGSKEIERYEDIAKFREETGCSSVMLARAAQWNCSIFRPEGLLPLDDVIAAYLCYAVDYDNAPANSKYCVQNMLRELQETPRGKKFLEAQTLQQMWYDSKLYLYNTAYHRIIYTVVL
jgi:tRNA-dihydrouridine synthase 2